MPRRCTICHHEERDEIDRLLSGGGAIGPISAKWGVSTDALKRHKANHLLPEMREKLAEDPELRDVDVLAEMKDLYRRMQSHLERVEETDNWQAIKAFHSEARADLELLAKLIGQLDERPVVNLNLSPEWLEMRVAIVGALDSHPEAKRAVLAALEAGGKGAA
jgi:hypothetical protein